MSSNQDDDFSSKITVLMIGVGSAALVVSLYHCITVGWCSRHRPVSTPRPQRYAPEITAARSSIENSAAQLIPAYKYRRGTTSAGEEGGTCAICLGEFEEGEELRTLPECVHTFHVPCIDMWLNSHSNCPVCRADAISSPQVVLRSMDFGPDGESDTFPTNVGMLQNVTVVSRTI